MKLKRAFLPCAVMAATLIFSASASAAEARGVVYEDQNANGAREAGEPGIPGVAVSNGLQVVSTGEDGSYQLPCGDDTILFVIKPSGWKTPYDHNGTVARFYYIHKPNGSPKGKYEGVAPTGPLPESVDFPLVRNEEPANFRMVVMGDPQPRDLRDVDFLSHDIYEELLTVPASLGASLGDLVFDGLEIYPDVIAQAGLLGIPWLHVIGNHDINFNVKNPRDSDDTYERYLGPSWYALNMGDVHFLVLNNIWWKVKERKYEGRFGEDQIEFIRNDLAQVSKDKLIVLMMHIPFQDCADYQEVIELLKPFPHTFSLSAHTHVQEHSFLPMGDAAHHHLNLMTAGGSWMRGQYDEVGIPHTTMRDGGPNGYAIMSFEGNQFSMAFKAARRPAEYQMDVWAPEQVSVAEAAGAEVVVNYFSGNEKSVVEMRLDRDGEWTPLESYTGKAPYYEREFNRHVALLKKIAELSGKDPNNEDVLKEIGDQFSDVAGRIPPEPSDTPHLWRGKLGSSPAPGYHVIQVRATDMWGKAHTAQRIIRVVE